MAMEPMTSSSSQWIYRVVTSCTVIQFLETQLSNHMFYCLHQDYYRSGITAEMIPALITINQVRK